MFSQMPTRRISRALFELEEDEVSDVIVSDDGAFHLSRCWTSEPEIPLKIVNRVMDKKALRDLVDYAYRTWAPRPRLSCPTA